MAFIAVTLISVVSNLTGTYPPPRPAQAQQEHKTTIKAHKKPIKKKTVKHTVKAKKASTSPTVHVQKKYIPPKPAPVPENEAKAFIYVHESGNRTDAINPTSGACGLGQALPCSKMPCSLQDYACQDAWFTNYMQQKYATWENARNFWLANNWW